MNLMIFISFPPFDFLYAMQQKITLIFLNKLTNQAVHIEMNL